MAETRLAASGTGRDTGRGAQETQQAASLRERLHGPLFALESGHFGVLRLPDPDFMPISRGVPYWKPHKICIKCYFSTAQCVTMRWIQANLKVPEGGNSWHLV